MDGEIKAVDICLAEWGKWMRNADDVLGWRKCSIIEKMKRDRDGASQSTAPTTVPDGIMATDAAIAQLRDIRQQVIKIAYLRFPNAPRDVQRRKLKMSRYRWNSLLREARLSIAASLGLSNAKG